MKLRKYKKVISIMLVIGMVFSLTLTSFASEDSSMYDVFNFTNGYGYVGMVGVRVTIGAEADINVKMRVRTVTQDQIIDLIQEYKSYFTNEQYNKIISDESYRENGNGAKLLCCLLETKYGDGSDNCFAKVKDQEVRAENPEDQALLRAIKDLTEQEYILSGNLKVKGLSYTPTEACCFVKVARIRFKDGSTLNVINTNGTIAEPDGTRDSITGSDENTPLDLIPLHE